MLALSNFFISPFILLIFQAPTTKHHNPITSIDETLTICLPLPAINNATQNLHSIYKEKVESLVTALETMPTSKSKTICLTYDNETVEMINNNPKPLKLLLISPDNTNIQWEIAIQNRLEKLRFIPNKIIISFFDGYNTLLLIDLLKKLIEHGIKNICIVFTIQHKQLNYMVPKKYMDHVPLEYLKSPIAKITIDDDYYNAYLEDLLSNLKSRKALFDVYNKTLSNQKNRLEFNLHNLLDSAQHYNYRESCIHLLKKIILYVHEHFKKITIVFSGNITTETIDSIQYLLNMLADLDLNQQCKQIHNRCTYDATTSQDSINELLESFEALSIKQYSH